MTFGKGSQVPTRSVVIPYKTSYGAEAVDIYESSGRKVIEWQGRLLEDIMSFQEDGLWIHQKFGYSVPRRNGKNEIIAIRELWGLRHEERMCHTAHRTTTSHSAWDRLRKLLADSGYTELGRERKGELPQQKSYRCTKQYGLESIALTGGGSIVFRTRTPNGGLGEGFDLLVIDEAQEYTEAQETALIYTVSDSKNPQTIFCGTPPTATSSGTVFAKMRKSALDGTSYQTGWAEWSIPEQTKDIWNTDLWYQTNPSMGYHLDERKIAAEIRGDIVDFNIQRLGVWIAYNQKSAISAREWERLLLKHPPKFSGKLYIGVKFGRDGTNTAVSLAVKQADGGIYIEVLGMHPARDGTEWIVSLLKQLDYSRITIDGASGQKLLTDALKDAGMKAPVLPTVKEIVAANAQFEQAVFAQTIHHGGQEGLAKVAGNCKHRPIGSGGGFGYSAIDADAEIAVLDSVILAHWLCTTDKGKKIQRIRY